MAGSTPTTAADALADVVRDFGRLVHQEPDRLRGLLEDVLGAHARAERLQIDALVAAAHEGVPSALAVDAAVPQRELEARLTATGTPEALASYAVSTWMVVLGARPAVTTTPGEDGDDGRTILPDSSLPPPPPRPPDETIIVDPADGTPVPPDGDAAGARQRPDRRRWLVAGGVAAAVLAVVGVLVAVQQGGDGSAEAITTASTTIPAGTTTVPPTTVAATTTTTTAPVSAPFPAETTPWGAALTRTWTVQDGAVFATLTFANPGAGPITGSQVEVVPKSIAATKEVLTFSVPPSVVTDDRVLQFDVALAPGETKTITYQAPLAAGVTPTAELLAGWMEEWKQAVAAYQASLDTTPPPLVIGAPANEQSVDSTELIVTGSSEPGATVTVNGQAAAVDGAGNWSIVLTLVETDTTVTVEAVDAKGNKAVSAVVVHYAPPAPEPDPTPTTRPRTGSGSTTTTAPSTGSGPVGPGPDTTTTTPAPEPQPDPPVARGDSYSWTPSIDAGGNIYAQVLSVLGNDSGSGLSISSVGGATHGSVSVSGGRIVYQPHHNGPFSDSFTYRIVDANGQTATASVSVSVGCNTSFVCYG